MSNNTGNPILDQNLAEVFDFRKYAEQLQQFQPFPVSGVDSQSLVETYRKNIEVLSQANRIVLEGAQAVAQRQGEIMRETMEEAVQVMQQNGNSRSPNQRIANDTEIAKNLFEAGVKNFRELAEMNAKSNTEALELINSRVSESLDELRDIIQAAVDQTQSAAGEAAGEVAGKARQAAERMEQSGNRSSQASSQKK